MQRLLWKFQFCVHIFCFLFIKVTAINPKQFTLYNCLIMSFRLDNLSVSHNNETNISLHSGIVENLFYLYVTQKLYSASQLTFVGASASTLQDIKVAESCGGFTYRDSGLDLSPMRNRFIYW